MDQTPGTSDLGNETPGGMDQDHAIRGWQMLAERRGQEAQTIRAERDALAARVAALEGADKVRQIVEDYPEAAELYLQQGAERITPADEPLLAAMQAGIASYEPRIDPNNPRRNPPKPKPQTVEELKAAIRAWPVDKA